MREKISGFTNYLISDKGEVKSLNFRRTGKSGLLSKCINSDGYEYVLLSINGKQYNKTVHRLVCWAFLYLSSIEEVNHIDGNKINNRLDNLEILTRSDNIKHSYLNRKGTFKKRSIKQFNLKGNFIKEFESISLASKETGINRITINRVCTGSRKTGKGFIWKYS